MDSHVENNAAQPASGQRCSHHGGFDASNFARYSAAEAVLFSSPPAIGWKGLVKLDSSYFSGTFIDQQGRFRAAVVGHPLSLTEARILTRGYETETAIMPASPFSGTIDGRMAFPFVGSFHGKDSPLSAAELEESGLRWLLDPQGEEVRYPVFTLTARSIMYPYSGALKVPVIDGNPFLITGVHSLREVVLSLGGERFLSDMEDLTERGLQHAYQEQQPNQDFESFKREFHDRGFAYTVITLLPELAASEHLRDRLELKRVPACAVKYKGAGCAFYNAHHVSRPQEEAAKLPYTRVLEQVTPEHTIVVDTRFEGSAGILLSIPHQDAYMVPLGAASSVEKITMAREQAVLNNGGVLSEISTGYVPLLDQSKIPELCTKEIGVMVIAVVDDVRRMDLFACPFEQLGLDRVYRAFVVEKYGPIDGGDSTSFVEDNFLECREKHLDELLSNLGLNLKALLMANLTNPSGQELMGNISVAGGVADLKNMMEMTDPHQAIGLIFPMMMGLSLFGRTAGLGSYGLFATEHFAKLGRNFLGKDWAKVEAFSKELPARPDEQEYHHIGILKLAGLMTDAWVSSFGVGLRGGYHLSDRELVERLQIDAQLRGKARISSGTLAGFALHLRNPSIPMIRGTRTISLEEGLEPYRAFLEDRMEEVPVGE